MWRTLTHTCWHSPALLSSTPSFSSHLHRAWHPFLIAKYAGACDPLRTAISHDMCHLAFVPPHWACHVGVAMQPCAATTCSISDYFFSWKYFRGRKLFSLARCTLCCCCCCCCFCSHCFFCCSHCCCLFFQLRCWQLLFVKWSDLFVVTARRGVKTFSLYFFYARNLFLRKFSASSRELFLLCLECLKWNGTHLWAAEWE